MNATALATLRMLPRLKPRTALDCTLAILLFLGTHLVFASARGVVQLCDSTYSLVATETLLKTGSLDLTHRIPADASHLPGYDAGQGLPYQFVRDPNTGRVHYGYPLGSSFLAIPWVAYYTVLKDRSTCDAAGYPRYEAEGLIQVRIASQMAAAVAVLFFVLCRCFLGPFPAALLAVGFAFGSPLYSTMARALWSHTGMVLWLTVAILLLVRLHRRVTPTLRSDLLFGVGLGTSLFWALFCRQHAMLSAAAIGVHLLLHHRRVLGFTLASGALWCGGLAAFSLAMFGTVQPPSVYAPGMMDGQDMANRLGWLLISPTRGLLVYCPYLVVTAAILVGGRRVFADAGLLLPAGLAIASHTLMIAAFKGWHANWAYGPRYFCDVLPWFVLIAALATAAIPALPRYRSAFTALLITTFAWGVFVHHRGANSREAWMWNDLTRTLGNAGAVKDWSHPQFLAGLTFSVNPDGSIREQ